MKQRRALTLGAIDQNVTRWSERIDTIRRNVVELDAEMQGVTRQQAAIAASHDDYSVHNYVVYDEHTKRALYLKEPSKQQQQRRQTTRPIAMAHADKFAVAREYHELLHRFYPTVDTNLDAQGLQNNLETLFKITLGKIFTILDK